MMSLAAPIASSSFVGARPGSPAAAGKKGPLRPLAVVRCSSDATKTDGDRPRGAYIPRDGSASTSRRGVGLMAAAAAAAALMPAAPAKAGLFGFGGGAGSEFMTPGQAKIANRIGDITMSEDEWLQKLGRDSYRILRQGGTEFPLTSPLNNEKREGTFVCAGCSQPLFTSTMKYNSGTGWPSFSDAIKGATMNVPDYSLPFEPRTEIRCSRCQGHLGHSFRDGPQPTGLRYCMNGLALVFEPAEVAAA